MLSFTLLRRKGKFLQPLFHHKTKPKGCQKQRTAKYPEATQATLLTLRKNSPPAGLHNLQYSATVLLQLTTYPALERLVVHAGPEDDSGSRRGVVDHFLLGKEAACITRRKSRTEQNRRTGIRGRAWERRRANKFKFKFKCAVMCCVYSRQRARTHVLGHHRNDCRRRSNKKKVQPRKTSSSVVQHI